MKIIFVLFLVLHCNLSFANDLEDSRQSYSSQKILVEANLEQLKNIYENPQDSSGNFIFMLAVPSAISMTADLIVIAGLGSYISHTMQAQLEADLASIDTDRLSLREIYNRLRSIFVQVDEEVQRSERNESRLREIGYTTRDLDELKEQIEVKSRMCSNNENNNSPEKFCPSYQNNFARDGYQLVKQSGAWKVLKKGKFQCCLEWDDVHCGFEIFDKKGRHGGEVGCLADEFNPCEANLGRGSHARPQPHNHRPRTKTCSK